MSLSSTALPLELPDPRRWPAQAPSGVAQRLHEHAERALAAPAGAAAEREDAHVDRALDAMLDAADGAALADAFASAPSVAVHRHLRRRLALREAAVLSTPALAMALFAFPVIVVAGREGTPPKPISLTSDAPPPAAAIDLPGVVPGADKLAALLREHGALGGNLQFGLSGALVALAALGLRRLPGLLAQARATLDGAAGAPLALPGSAIRVDRTQEAVHLRFLVGSALFAPSADPLGDAAVGAWVMPLSGALSRSLAVPGATVLALPRAPQRLVPALAAGMAAQREIAVQLFTGNTLRRLRERVGEPTAVLSAHRAADAPGGGELRLSLSSPFDPRDAEGFRYALQPCERVPDAVASLAALLRDCRVSDVRVAPGVRPDRDLDTGLLRFCKPADCEAGATLH